jgi:hypothetical protein
MPEGLCGPVGIFLLFTPLKNLLEENDHVSQYNDSNERENYNCRAFEIKIGYFTKYRGEYGNY